MKPLDSVAGFVQAWCENSPGARIKGPRLFEAYEAFCTLSKVTPVAPESFYRSLEDSDIVWVERRGGLIVGLKIRKEFLNWGSRENTRG